MVSQQTEMLTPIKPEQPAKLFVVVGMGPRPRPARERMGPGPDRLTVSSSAVGIVDIRSVWHAPD